MEMEVLYTYKNQLLASDGYTCVMSTCQKVEWSGAFISASCLNMRTVKCPLFSNPPIKVALVGAMTALLLYRGAATFSSWRVAAACDYREKKPQKNHQTTQQGHDPDRQCLHCIALSWSQDLSLHFILPSLMTSHLVKVTLMSSNVQSALHYRNKNVPRVFFWLTELNQKTNKSALRFAAWFLHQHLSDVICHFAVHSVVKRTLETQYSNKYFQPLQ